MCASSGRSLNPCTCFNPPYEDMRRSALVTGRALPYSQVLVRSVLEDDLPHCLSCLDGAKIADFILHAGYQAQQRPAAEYNGYYGNRMSYKRPESYAENSGTSHDPYGSGRRGIPRNQSEPMLNGQSNAQSNVQPNGSSNAQGVYPSHAHQQSYDTVGTASYGSDGTHQWGNSTDPSSENSSIDRVQPPQKPDLGEVYGFNGFGGAPQFQGPILEEHGQGTPGYGQPGYGKGQAVAGVGNPYQGNGAAPPPPPHKETRPRVPIKLGAPSVASRAPPAVDSDKRKSWLKRRFSRKN